MEFELVIQKAFSEIVFQIKEEEIRSQAKKRRIDCTKDFERVKRILETNWPLYFVEEGLKLGTLPTLTSYFQEYLTKVYFL